MNHIGRPWWVTSGILLLSAFAWTMLFFSCDKADETKVAILVSENQEQTNETQALTRYLNRYEFLQYQKVFLKDTGEKTEKILRDYDIVWYHHPDSSDISHQLTRGEIIKQLKNYVRNGGNLLLTLDAIKYITHLGLEEKQLSSRQVEAIDRGFGRKRGLHAYRHHPVFKGLHGGSYIFSPEKDTVTRITGYFDNTVPENGNVVAVDWAYIHMHEQHKLMLEYTLGNGKIMGIGAYTRFNMDNHHTRHLETFMNNVLGYLSGNIKGKKHYWDYGDQQVKPLSLQTEEYMTSKKPGWKEPSWNLKFEHQATDNFFDVAGERMVVMGKEKGGIEEIWTHPFMALRDYEVGYRSSKDDSIHWLSNQMPQVRITPNTFTRKYKVAEGTLKEVITTAIKEPVGALHYDYNGKDKIQLYVRFFSNMRLMWPYSSGAIGAIHKTFDKNLNAFIFTDKSKDFVCTLGADQKPTEQLTGQFNEFSLKRDKPAGKRTNQLKTGALAAFDMPSGNHLNIVIGATNQGIEKTTSIYRKYINDPEKIRKDSRQYYKKLLRDKLMMESPDSIFNEAYRWAVIGTDRFFVHTPGLGKSLVAGYGTSKSGWDGGHQVSGRPGYAWYFGRDGQWSGFAMDGYGDFEKVRSILEIYMKYQDLNGKIFHELTTSGAVHYDAADATPLFVVLAGHYMRHTGDVSFIENNWKAIKKAMDFCFSTDRNNDHLIENTGVGHGWVEGGHLFGGRSTLYLAGCWGAALQEASTMAETIGKNSLADRYSQEAKTVQKIINKDFWNPGNKFFHHSLMPDGSYMKEITVMPAIPLYYGQIKQEKQKPVLERFATNNFSSDWGVRIVPRDNPRFNPRGYHTGSVWPLYTGWTALAEYNNRRPLQGFTHVRNNLRVYRHWAKGFVEEVLNGNKYQPGGVCAHQCWSETMALQPLYEGMLGYRPQAQKNTVTLAPALPPQWDSLRVKNISMGDYKIHFNMHKTPEGTRYYFSKNSKGKVRVHFKPTLRAGSKVKDVFANGSKKKYRFHQHSSHPSLEMSFKLINKTVIDIHHSRGIAVLPVEYNPEPGDKSHGIRVIKSSIKNNSYQIMLQGPQGQTKSLKVDQGNFRIEKVNNGIRQSVKRDLYKIRTTFPESRDKNYTKRSITLELQ